MGSDVQGDDTVAGRYCLNTYSYTQTMGAADCLRHLARKGARDIELMTFPGHVWIDDDQRSLRNIRSIIDGEGLRLSSINTVNVDLNIAGAAAEMRAYSLGLVEVFLRIAGVLGAQGFILGPGKANPLLPLPTDRLQDYFFQALDRLLPVAREHGVGLWVENMPFAFLPTLDGVLNAVDTYGSSEVGICYDVANAHFVGEDPAAGIRRLGQRLDLLHLSDTTRQAYRHAAIGTGDVDFAGVWRAAREVGLRRVPVLEIISTEGDRDLFEAPLALRERGFASEGRPTLALSGDPQSAIPLVQPSSSNSSTSR